MKEAESAVLAEELTPDQAATRIVDAVDGRS